MPDEEVPLLVLGRSHILDTAVLARPASTDKKVMVIKFKSSRQSKFKILSTALSRIHRTNLGDS